MEKEHKGFTLWLALVDTIPVITFMVSILLIASRFKSTLFLIGAIVTACAGAGKVLWKVIMAIKDKDIVILQKQFRYLISSGFLIMLLAAIINHKKIVLTNLFKAVTSFPAIIFFGLAIATIFYLVYLAKHMDQRNAKSNWFEQGINIMLQVFLLLGIIFSI